jgi:hypothetical protein
MNQTRLPETKGSFCVSTVSIVCSRDAGLPDRARVDVMFPMAALRFPV